MLTIPGFELAFVIGGLDIFGLRTHCDGFPGVSDFMELGFFVFTNTRGVWRSRRRLNVLAKGCLDDEILENLGSSSYPRLSVDDEPQ